MRPLTPLRLLEHRAALRPWLPLLSGAAFTGLVVSSLTVTEPPCVYVLGQVGDVTMATPALVVFVPPAQAAVQPVRVHLDEAGQHLLGYSLRPHEGAASSDETRVFVQGPPEAGAPLTALPELGGRVRTCSNLGVSTPAVPISVPSSAFEDLSSALTEVPDLGLTLQDTSVTVPAHVLTLQGRTLVLPLHGATPEPVGYDLPRQSLVLGLSRADAPAHYLSPPRGTAGK
ncbi:hypothetical protein [Archangium sp.]|uniref:hypothetical protein n=1 Tax=Archangium sp. TaxID=1872627 RepID=UPI00286B3644|nr:hypothetical protein [Archangium sp.]